MRSVLARVKRQVVARLRRAVAPVEDYYTGWHSPQLLRMGRGSYGRPRVIAYRPDLADPVTVGNFCSIAAGTRFFLDGNHRIDFLTTSHLNELGGDGPPGHNAGRGPITIGHDVWIGRDATILSGVTIGTGAVVGACAVVARDVRPYAIVVGNPAQEARRRFSDADCETLLASRWWEWPNEQIVAAREDLWSGDVGRFAERWLQSSAPAPGGPC
jgi:acetyltransferase-like isoleucine patch superfamily enzyme